MTRRLTLVLLAFAFLFLSSCGKEKGMSLADLTAQTQGKKIGVVSLSVNDYNGMLSQWGVDAGGLLDDKMNGMLGQVEALLAQKWTVVPAAEFVVKPEYQSLATEAREVAVPKPGGAEMKLFGTDRKQLIGAVVDPAKVAQLAAATGVDLVFVAYSEWEVATGGFVPTSKPNTKNVIKIYDATGKLMFSGRKDLLGKRTLGAMGIVKVDEETVDDWVAAAVKGYTVLLGEA